MIVARGLGQKSKGNIVSYGLGARVLEIIELPPTRWHRDGFSTMHAHDVDVAMGIDSLGRIDAGIGGWSEGDILWVDPEVGWIGRIEDAIAEGILSNVHTHGFVVTAIGNENATPTMYSE